MRNNLVYNRFKDKIVFLGIDDDTIDNLTSIQVGVYSGKQDLSPEFIEGMKQLAIREQGESILAQAVVGSKVAIEDYLKKNNLTKPKYGEVIEVLFEEIDR